jgi:hypothetical protein
MTLISDALLCVNNSYRSCSKFAIALVSLYLLYGIPQRFHVAQR